MLTAEKGYRRWLPGLASALAALAACLFLTSVAPAPLGSAVIDKVLGSGAVYSASEGARPWRSGTPLQIGDTLEPGEDGRVVVAVGPALRFCIASSSRLTLARLDRERLGSRYRVEARLDHGRAWVFVADDSAVTIHSPVGRASFHHAAVEVARVGDTMRVAAWRGDADYSSDFMDTVQYSLSPGEEVLADRARKDHQIRPVPHRPLERWQMEMMARIGPP